MNDIGKQSDGELYQRARMIFSTGQQFGFHNRVWTINKMEGEGVKQLLTLQDVESGDKESFDLEDLNPIGLPNSDSEHKKQLEKQAELERLADMVVDKMEERFVKEGILREIISDIISDMYLKVRT